MYIYVCVCVCVCVNTHTVLAVSQDSTSDKTHPVFCNVFQWI